MPSVPGSGVIVGPPPAAAGVTDHGALTGLGDDDHPQYLTQAEADARYWQLSTDLATQAELDAHAADTTAIHGIADTSVLDTVSARDSAISTHAADTTSVHGLTETREGALEVVLDGGGVALTTGVKGFIEVPFACTVTGWRLVADQSGSIVVDVWKDTYANFPPVDGDRIAGTEKPTLSSAQKAEDTNLTTWTTALAKGDWLAFEIESATTVTRVTLSLLLQRS